MFLFSSDSVNRGEVYTKTIPQTALKTAVLGNDAGIVGAAMLGR